LTQANHWISYSNSFEQDDPRPLAFRNTADKFVKNVISAFDHNSRVNGLLFGQVQSGKTTHTFSVIAATADADPGFNTFVYLTSNSTQLHQQTLGDALEKLSNTFEVCGPDDELRFRKNHRRPNLVILNKDKSVLAKWASVLESDPSMPMGPIFIVDDEGDSASQNALVNKNDESKIYAQIKSFRALGTGSVYLQVTATPQALFMQSTYSDEKPKFIHYFDPGDKYLGGEFFFGRDDSITHVPISEDDFEELTHGAQGSQGLRQALAFFVVVAAYFSHLGRTNANCLVHPHFSRGSHVSVHAKTVKIIKELTSVSLSPEFEILISEALVSLNAKTDKKFTRAEFDAVVSGDLNISSVIINADNKVDEADYKQGYNVIVGANAIGRGVAFPHLQTVYYTRKAKTPQADTFWQHSRIFGYDRDWQVLRIFMPASLFRLFRVLQDQNHRLIEMIKSDDFDIMQIALPKGINATRSQVVDRGRHKFVVGGTNYFPSQPNQENAEAVDKLLEPFGDSFDGPVDLDIVKKVIELAGDPAAEWKSKSFIKAIDQGLKDPKASLLLRRNRKISSNTGSMLSPNDREYGDGLKSQLVITAYRVDGLHGKWSLGKDFWLVNIKLPGSLLYHEVE
jgi:hypothetical protein